MRDIAIGIVILVVCFLVGDFLYSEKNYCDVGDQGYVGVEAKCGIIKKNFDIDINLFGRYW